MNALTGRRLAGWLPIRHADGSEGIVALDPYSVRVTCNRVPMTMTKAEAGENIILSMKRYGAIVSTHCSLHNLKSAGAHDRSRLGWQCGQIARKVRPPLLLSRESDFNRPAANRRHANSGGIRFLQQCF